MSETQAQTDSLASIDTDESYALSNIGIEFEYPVAYNSNDAPATQALDSNDLYDQLRQEGFEYGGEWLTDTFGHNDGYVGHDHVGAEITSHILDLHSDEPERWYERTIAEAENRGYPFAAAGYGDTSFGLHMHLSEFGEEDHEQLVDITSEPWGQVFFCASVEQNAVDPWRHGGINPTSAGRIVGESAFRGTPNPQYEFRLPEPGVPEHVSLIFDFFRLWARESPEAAEEFAYERVTEKDERLTAIQQYEIYQDRLRDWPDEHALSNNAVNNGETAKWFHDLME